MEDIFCRGAQPTKKKRGPARVAGTTSVFCEIAAESRVVSLDLERRQKRLKQTKKQKQAKEAGAQKKQHSKEQTTVVTRLQVCEQTAAASSA